MTVTTVTNMPTRTYSSELRAEQARATRSRILEEASRLALRTFELPSHADVARAARVAERTVYRHFPTVRELHDSLAQHQQRLRPEMGADFEIEDLPEQFANLSARLRAAGMTDVIGPERKRATPTAVFEGRQRRFAGLEGALARKLPHATKMQIRQLALVFFTLSSLETFMRGLDHLGLPPEEVAPPMVWAMELLLERISRGELPGNETKRKKGKR